MADKNFPFEMMHTAEIFEARQKIYSFLAGAFLEAVSEHFLRGMLDIEDYWPLQESNSPREHDFEKGLSLLYQSVHRLGGNGQIEEAIKELRREFTSLFIAKGRNAVHPYESVYLGGLGLLMQEPYEEVRKFFGEAGITREKGSREIEDHVGVELEFMAIMCQSAVEACRQRDWEAVRSYLGIQARFLREHLARWVTALCEDILKNARGDFYRGVAYLTRGFIRIETEEIEKLINDGLVESPQ